MNMNNMDAGKRLFDVTKKLERRAKDRDILRRIAGNRIEPVVIVEAPKKRGRKKKEQPEFIYVKEYCVPAHKRKNPRYKK